VANKAYLPKSRVVVKAKSLCPKLILVPPRMEAYKIVSNQIRSIFKEYTDLIEPLSLDEAYLDVTQNKRKIETATEIAKEIKVKIHEATQLTASAGISNSKFLAKIASDLNKPNGLTVIHPRKAKDFIKNLSIEKFHGIGKKTSKKMIDMGINTGGDILRIGEIEMVRQFGKNGKYFHDMALGKDDRAVNPERERKSVSVENTFIEDLFKIEDIEYELSKLAYLLEKRIQKSRFESKTLTVKIKYADFQIVNRNRTGKEIVRYQEQIIKIAKPLIESLPLEKGVRLLGIGVSLGNATDKESPGSHQLTLEF